MNVINFRRNTTNKVVKTFEVFCCICNTTSEKPIEFVTILGFHQSNTDYLYERPKWSVIKTIQQTLIKYFILRLQFTFQASPKLMLIIVRDKTICFYLFPFVLTPIMKFSKYQVILIKERSLIPKVKRYTVL